MKKNLAPIILGIIIIAIGIIALGNGLGFWTVNLFFKGWWSLFIIVPSFIGLFNKQTIPHSIIGLVLGVLLLLSAMDVIKWSVIWQIFIPVVIILIGALIIFRPKFKRVTISGVTKNYIGVFSSCEQIVSEEFTSCKCVTVFGGIDLDLRNAKIVNDAVIDCYCIFGGIDIKVPSNVIVKANGIPVFGGVENKVINEENSKNTILNINYICIFGGIDIK